ncbi:protocadherin Fat 4-like [Paramuricea clavata]|uniref:Protocadherin Fat 4-like n=1 Tax=Paramuricea clavata TaxID=317549 RepID=A0A6S7G9X1_PARCT|nr:protocadherin Fat 4-like [Paramuricea clavata]
MSLANQYWPTRSKVANISPLAKIDVSTEYPDFRGINVTTVIARKNSRSVRLQTKDKDKKKLGRLAGLAIEAGFNWVEYTDSKYIRASVIPDACQTAMDLVFVLDNSGTVGVENFEKVKDFVKRVINVFNIGADGTHVSVVTYGTYTHIEFNLVKYFTKNELRNAVDDIKYNGSLTYTGEALNTVRQKVFTASAGMRNDYDIPKILLLLTDGFSNGIKPLEPANQLRDLGVSIFSIGVGPSVSQSELKEIASDPDRDHVFTLSSFNQLTSFVDRVSYVSCSEGSLINSCKGAETTVERGSFKYFRTTFDVITKDEVSIEVRDLTGLSHLYASATSKNPGPLDSAGVKNEEDTNPRTVSVTVNNVTKAVYVAVQGQKDTNKFRLSFWDNLFVNSGTFQVNVTEGLDPHEIITLNMVQHSYNLEFMISDGDKSLFSVGKSNSVPKLSTLVKLDYETSPKYSVVVVAQDLANQCHKSRALVKINVIGQNDNARKVLIIAFFFFNTKTTSLSLCGIIWVRC